MIIQIVHFKSELPEEKIFEIYEVRAPRFRALKGLTQKYYVRFTDTGEYGAIYVWESEEALNEFRKSELYRTIATAYQVQGTPGVQMADLVMTLRPEPAHEKATGA